MRSLKSFEQVCLSLSSDEMRRGLKLLHPPIGRFFVAGSYEEEYLVYSVDIDPQQSHTLCRFFLMLKLVVDGGKLDTNESADVPDQTLVNEYLYNMKHLPGSGYAAVGGVLAKLLAAVEHVVQPLMSEEDHRADGLLAMGVKPGLRVQTVGGG